MIDVLFFSLFFSALLILLTLVSTYLVRSSTSRLYYPPRPKGSLLSLDNPWRLNHMLQKYIGYNMCQFSIFSYSEMLPINLGFSWTLRQLFV
ncbi:hypothetical protein CI102_2408 [Trichoderma harzianum]|uniref:Uncharacterized protein n=1 Tax=Trichoderma harzianum CBS 226.95 TaxID=983964 RepID=A0A2T4AM90_TRIHA|nr:hypothetical protein M431DRAFT_360596 [Trichoderma harzianum CBS 226.95]PKK52689.1 hypothetical protein CI102_2408 [Trichoderma harzianum]PTB58183.1 hypothetical protein M431DRAFT_360596 [Trichoderma harzianum CBS 226.95]